MSVFCRAPLGLVDEEDIDGALTGLHLKAMGPQLGYEVRSPGEIEIIFSRYSGKIDDRTIEMTGQRLCK